MRNIGERSVLLALALALAAAPAYGQWSTDPASNLVIADRSGDQVQSKIVATPDGGFYISWFDNSTGGYDVYLQRLDISGTEQWAHNGVLVADRAFSSTQNYGLGIDTAGNALLAFRDDRGGPIEITVAKVGADGSQPWGATGIQVSAASGAFVAAPKVVGTSDGNVVVAWTRDINVKLQKLDAAGAPLWGAGVTLSHVTDEFSLSDLQAADAGMAIVSFIHQTGFMAPKHLWAQKLASADGAVMWGAGHVQVYDQGGGSLQFGNFPPFVGDGAGGAVFAWYTSSPSLQSRVQRVLANGTEAFAHQGVEVSTNASQIRVNPRATFDGASQSVYAFFVEQSISQSQSGVYGQRVDAAGARQWTDSGLVLVPVGANSIGSLVALPLGGDGVIAWSNNGPVQAARLDEDGNFVWTPTIVDLATTASGTSRMAGAVSSAGYAAFAWSEGDILAQNVNGDGTLGPTAIFTDGFESGDTTAWSRTVP